MTDERALEIELALRRARGPKGRFASPAVVGGSTCEGSP